MLHPQFVAIHSPTGSGSIHDKERFLTDTARPTPQDIQILDATIRHFDDMATVNYPQDVRMPFVSDVPPFVIQQASSRVWLRADDRRQLAHPVRYRRMPPA